ncbi:tetratricopeptide repeat protein [Streptomyces sp. MZ04]|uniref:tetratricopeptide repeat protein n=1 Tax=Streptomyces sp. MZ04 TaxID=2559236 RepID=UPI00107E9578|nr:tetratricopeptide repeat protein [Streptomyces sp. MZ04]TGB15541.1 tetratricopeptide repeat protein [Streptomyces sp. MZ04]
MPVPASFTDRVSALWAVTDRLARLPSDTARIVVIRGGSGIGKTTLASRLIHEHQPQFPGGQLYADLRGYAPSGPARTPEVLAQLLRSIRPGAQPTSPEDLGALWRSATAADPDRPVCLLLDNVVRGNQIRPLLPGGPGHLVVVTSRDPLAELAPDGAVRYELGPFDESAVRDYLSACLGDERTAPDREAIAELTRLSAGSPLALALAVTELAADPDQSLAGLLTALSHPHRQTSTPHNPQETAVTTALARAYQELPSGTALVYRRMGHLFPLDLDAATTAAACNLSQAAATQALQDLREVHLLEAGSTEADPVRGPLYRFHDAARGHAANLAAQEDGADALAAALRRTLDFYLQTTTAAERRITPTHRHLSRDYVYPPAEPIQFSDDAPALAWLKAQRHNLLAAVRAADAARLDSCVWQQAHSLWPLLRESHDYTLWFKTHELGIQAARRCGDRVAERELLGTMGIALRGAGRYSEAITAYTRVLEMACADGDSRSESQTRHELGATYLAAGQLQQAQPLLVEARALRESLGASAESERDWIYYRRGIALTDICLGQVHLGHGQANDAIATLTSAREVLLQLPVPDRFDAARALAFLGRAYARGGDLETAKECGRQAAAEFSTRGSVRWGAHSLEMLGQTAQDAGRHEQAAELFTEALALYKLISPRDADRVRERLRRAR